MTQKQIIEAAKSLQYTKNNCRLDMQGLLPYHMKFSCRAINYTADRGSSRDYADTVGVDLNWSAFEGPYTKETQLARQLAVLLYGEYLKSEGK